MKRYDNGKNIAGKKIKSAVCNNHSSSPECMMEKGCITKQKATAVKQHIMREYREDMVVT